MDLLSRILSSFKIESTSISQWHLSAPWGVNITDFKPGFCLNVVNGHCWLTKPNSAPIKLLKGDSIIALNGLQCCLTSDLGAPTISIQELPWEGESFKGLNEFEHPVSPQRVHLTGDGNKTFMLGLAFTFQGEHEHFFSTRLPELLILREAESNFFSLINPVLEFLIHDDSPGYFALASNLAEFAIIGLLRSFLTNENSHSIGLIQALQDPPIHKILTTVHNYPDKNWTIDSLANLGNISRSTLSKRFQLYLRSSPIEYLNRVRIELAANLLLHSDKSLSVIISETGFETERSFRRAFNTYKLIPPSKFRKLHKKRTMFPIT